MLIRVKFFGELKEKTGKKSVELTLEPLKIRREDFIRILEKKFDIPKEKIFNIAVNSSLSEDFIEDGDTVSIHPVYRGG